MDENKFFCRRSFWENNGGECFTCSKKFRSGDRRRVLELNVIVCAACHQSHIRFQSASADLSETSIMDIDMINDHLVLDVATQTDFDFVHGEAIIPAMVTTSSNIKNSSISTELDARTVHLPFFRIPKSCNRCSICGKYFINSDYSSTKIRDSIRATTLINHHVFVPENSRCCSRHLDVTDFRPPAIDSIKKKYDPTCLIKINELVQLLECLKAELKKYVSYRKSKIFSLKIPE